MLFTHDTDDALRGAAALVNSVGAARPPGGDRLATTDDLARFYREWSWSGPLAGTAAELAEVRSLRPRLRRVWLAASDAEFAERVNALLADARALPRLVDHDGYGWHVHATEPGAPLARRMQAEAAMALVDVLRAGQRDRLRICAAPDCENVVVDLSRNRSRRYCDAGCGNRLAAAAYRARNEGE